MHEQDPQQNRTVSGAPVTVFSTKSCGWCRRAEELLARHAIPFQTVDITGDRRAREDLIDRANWRTVPVIFVEGRPIGGYQELARLLNAGGLAHLRKIDQKTDRTTDAD